MTARLNTVTHVSARRRRSAAPARQVGLSPRTISLGIRNTAIALWDAARFGPINSPWIPSPTAATCEQRLIAMVELVDDYLRRISGCRWSLYLDRDDRPGALLLDRMDGASTAIPLKWQGRFLYFGPEPMSMAGPVGMKLLDLIAVRCGGLLGQL